MKLNILFCAALSAFTSLSAKADDIAPIIWYGMMPHPYIAEVQKGAEAAAKDFGIKIDTTVGQEWTQANETQNIEQQSARGYKAISLFPGDPTGASARRTFWTLWRAWWTSRW